MSVIFGTTNTDGTGSASNLTAENGNAFDLDNLEIDHSSPYEQVGSLEIDDVILKYTNDHYGYATTYITNNGEWNADGAKELLIEYTGPDSDTALIMESRDTIRIDNFVDVNIHLEGSMPYEETYGASEELWLEIIDAKRADIDATDFDAQTVIRIATKSNGEHGEWSNMFNIQGSDTHHDEVQFEGSSYTEFNVSLNGGSDRFTSMLAPKESADQIRFVDGGEGNDEITIYGNSSDIEFVNFENVSLASGSSFTLNEEVLQNNADGLKISTYQDSMDISFSDDYDSITAKQQYDENGDETGYLDVTVSYDDADYHLVVQDTGQEWNL
ncbi:hypothetical protein SAMN04488136_104211 [Vibrio xiamenensis]|uniref:Uncharacterized protein n=1 Tax=Vibrio xiamenensis TaxID=861298 RepID=A0A1G7Y631_9VIBR|nr:hypothetical protein [Vibrio xiamenensis]SDG91450.1 hypothetical protein SAMN04488136_104211 [Vibrio xiamenensis]